MSKFLIFSNILTAILNIYVFVCSYKYFSQSNRELGIKEWLLIILFSVVATLNNLYNFMYLKTAITILIFLIIYYKIFKDSMYKTLYLGIFIFVLSLAIEFLLSILVVLFVSNVNVLNNEMHILKISFSVIYGLSFYYIYKIRIFKTIYLNLSLVFEKRKSVVIIFYLILGIIAAFSILFVLDYKNIIIYILGLFIFLSILLISGFYFKEIYSNQLLSIKNKYLIENQIIFKNNMEEYRLLKHNLLNDFLFIKTFCNEEAQLILDEKIKNYKIKTEVLNDINQVPEGLQGLIYIKSSIARSKDIHFYIDNNIETDFKHFNKQSYIDLCEIIGIVLDNAIEACENTTEKVIYLNIFKVKKNCGIEIINTFSNDIDLNEIGNKNYSTKERNSGLGLNHIKNLNSKIKIKTEIINNLFKVSIMLLSIDKK